MYREAAHIIAPPLTHIINVSIQRQQFPAKWKTSLITPIPKSQPVSKDELRPISLLPIFSKICEKVILNSGMATELQKTFGPNQFGAMHNSSTTTALICIHDTITRLLEDPFIKGIFVIAYDFSKAFDQLGHDIIIRELSNSNFPISFVKWLNAYLSHRSQMVKINNTYSDQLLIKSGIPQGSVFGPFLFNSVVGSLRPKHDVCTIVKYVDDCTYIIPVYESARKLHFDEHLQMVQWSSHIGLRLNLRKSKQLWIPKTSTFVPEYVPDIFMASELRILGVYITPDLKWTRHVEYICGIAARRLYALRILKPHLGVKKLTSVFFALIVSLVEYCSPLLVGSLNQNDEVILKLLRRAHRIISGNHAPTGFLGLPNIKERRERAAIKLFNSISNNPSHLLHHLCPLKSLRTGRYIQPQTVSVRRRNSFFPRTVILINKIFTE